jgi:hypothetical protein
LRVSLRTSAEALIMADELTLECVVTVPGKLRVELPDAEIELGDWTLAEFAKEAPKLLESGEVQHVLRYTLEPNLPGAYLLPQLVIRAGDYEVRTEASGIDVRSIIEAPHKAKLRPLAEAPTEEYESYWPYMALGLALLGLGALFGIRNRRPVEPSSQVQALAAIEAAATMDELAHALRTWAPSLLARLDAHRFRQQDDADFEALVEELQRELQEPSLS